MLNVSQDIKGDILTVKIDLSQDHGPTSTGKNTTVAKTGGNQSILHKGETFKLGINCYK